MLYLILVNVVLFAALIVSGIGPKRLLISVIFIIPYFLLAAFFGQKEAALRSFLYIFLWLQFSFLVTRYFFPIIRPVIARKNTGLWFYLFGALFIVELFPFLAEQVSNFRIGKARDREYLKFFINGFVANMESRLSQSGII